MMNVDVGCNIVRVSNAIPTYLPNIATKLKIKVHRRRRNLSRRMTRWLRIVEGIVSSERGMDTHNAIQRHARSLVASFAPFPL